MRDSIMPKLGPLERLIYDFKNHHPRPDALGRRSARVHLRSTSLFATLPFALLANLAFLLLPLPLWLLAGTLSFIIGATFAQYFHASLHRTDNPRAIQILRDYRLLMRPEGHVRHHATLTCDFSTITGWSNPALNVLFNALRKSGRMRDEGLIPR
jgi:sterol desaturase/sphingolipid hydroxylase (fatty acid hydroxylase superfamily)